MWTKTTADNLFADFDGFEFEDVWYKARVKWDGCIDLERYFNVPANAGGRELDRMHICDIDAFIKRLQALRVAAKEHFGEED